MLLSQIIRVTPTILAGSGSFLIVDRSNLNEVVLRPLCLLRCSCVSGDLSKHPLYYSSKILSGL